MMNSSGKSSWKSFLGSAIRYLRPLARFPVSCGTACCGESLCTLSKALFGIVKFEQVPVTFNRGISRWLGGAGWD